MTIGVPGNVPYVITVGSMSDGFTEGDETDDYLSSYSGVGPTMDAFIKPDVVSPGGHLLGLMPPDSYIAMQHPEFHDAQDYFIMSGTSQAAAVASGVVALILDDDPTLLADDVKCVLMSTTKSAVGKDKKLAYSVFQQGAGLINAKKAVGSKVSLGCGNSGLNIYRDLYTDVHFMGPARHDPANGFYIEGASDTYNWDTNYSWDGFFWIDGSPFLDGSPFIDADLSVTGTSINVWVEQE